MKQASIDQLMGNDYSGRDEAVSAMYRRNREYLNDLLTSVKRRQIIPFIGAGYTAGIYPLWRNLILSWARELGDAPFLTIQTLVESGDLEAAASKLVEIKGEYTVKNDLLLTFGKNTLDKAAASISPERAGLSRAFQGPILTTNYDRIIERIYSDSGTPLEIIYPYIGEQRAKAMRILQQGQSALFKLHGDCEDPDNVIFTSESYKRAYGGSPAIGNGPTLVDILSRAFKRNQALFLGCSLESDRTLKVLSSNNENLWHYALVELPLTTKNKRRPFSPHLTINGEVDGLYLDKSNRLMERFHIRPIWYPSGEHLCLDAMLGWLETEVDLTPRGRRPFGLIPRSNYKLIGRDKNVNEIKKLCRTPGTITIVSGPGGIGKTEVCKTALRCLYNSGQDVVYCVAIEAYSASEQCDAIAKALQIPPLNHMGNMAYETYFNFLFDAAATKVSFDKKPPILYIDNWDTAWNALNADRDAILNILDFFADRGFSVLVSSRSSVVDYEIGNRILLDALDSSNSRRLYLNVVKSLGQSSDGLSKPERTQLLKKLSGYPLALILTARQVVNALDKHEVLQSWVLAEQHSRDSRHSSLNKALHITWHSISRCRYAQQAWGVVALSPAGISGTELFTIVRHSDMDEEDWSKAIQTLRDLGIVTYSNGILDMLPPIREVCFTFSEEKPIFCAYDLLGSSFIDLLESSDLQTSLENWSKARKQVSAALSRMLELLRRALSSFRSKPLPECPLPRYAYALAQYYSLNPAVSDQILSKLIDWADDCSNHKLSAFASLQKAISSYMLDNIEDSKSQLENTLNYSQPAQEHILTEKALLVKAQWCRLQNSYQKSMDLIELAEDERSSYSDSKNPELLLERARIARLQSDYAGADNLIDLIIKDSKQGCDYRTLAAAYHERGMIYRLKDKFSESSIELKKAESIYHAEGNNQGIANILFEEGQNEALTGHLKRSTKILASALKQYQLAGNLFGINNVLYEQAKLLAGIYSPLFEQLRVSSEDFDEANNLLDKVDTFYQQIESVIDMANVKLVRAKIAYARNDAALSTRLMNEAIQMYATVNAEWGIHNVRDAARERNIELQQ